MVYTEVVSVVRPLNTLHSAPLHVRGLFDDLVTREYVVLYMFDWRHSLYRKCYVNAFRYATPQDYGAEYVILLP